MSDKPFIGTKAATVNNAWLLWIERHPTKEILAKAAQPKTQLEALEAGFKLGYMNALIAFETGSLRKHLYERN